MTAAATDARAATDAWSLQRLPPGWAALVFSARTFFAAMLALYIAFLVGLERPAWAMATVYIVSQPISGAALAKGFYRIIGTLVGGLFTLMTLPLLVDAPVLLTLALSLWIGGCLYLSLRDRTPRSYVFMLAGYSAAIMGFPNVDAPVGLFNVVVTRVQEIGLGILCATVFSALVLPQTSHAAGLARMRQWLRSADAQAAGLLRGTLTRQEMASGERGLAREITALQALMIYLSYEPAVSRAMRVVIRSIHGHAVLMLRLLAEIRDRLVELRLDGPLDPALAASLERLALWAERGIDSDPQEGAACARALSDAARRVPEGGEGWRAATLLNLAERVNAYVDVREDCRTLWQALKTERAPDSSALRVPGAGPMSALAPIDAGNARRAALALILALWVNAAFWILTAWPDGATAMMMIAIAASVTASQSRPVPALYEFIYAALIALVLVFVYQFAILPFVTDFAQMCLVLFPALLVCGVLMAMPRTAGVGFGITITFTTLLGLQNMFSGDLAAFANGNSAAVVGMCVALAAVSLLRPRSAEQAAIRLLRHGWEDVAALARLPDAAGRQGITRRLVDRLGLLAPTLTPRRGDDGEVAFATLFAAEGVLALAQLSPHVTAAARGTFERLLADVEAHFRLLVRGGHPDPSGLLATLDSMRAEMAGAPGPRAEAGLSALVSLRRGLMLGQGRAA
ncbi:FUSC family protein [Aquabacter cavernae]|uniref:FUSC family protein n=1 Tax=Aquabacter cavernae TaxID=2496029 RepID=UPI000F8C4D01|nr:FUSC family protein [Aquabacter cavernae]